MPDGTKVKAGGMVTYVPYSMGRMEYNWGSDAASFKPERWLKDGFFQNASPFKFTAFQVSNRRFRPSKQRKDMFGTEFGG